MPNRTGQSFDTAVAKNDHTLKQCPLPFQSKLAFAPVRKTTQRTFVVNNQAESIDEVIGGGEEELERDPDTSTESAPLFEQIHIATEEEERDWVASRLGESDQIMAFDNGIDDEVFLSEQIPLPISIPSVHFIIDSGANSTVCGEGRLMRTASRFGFPIPSKWIPSLKTFRFGNMSKYSSMGRLILSGEVTGKTGNIASKAEELSISIDVISLDVPLILSKATLQSLHATLDFHNDCISFLSGLQVPLIRTPGGHVYFDWKPYACKTDRSLSPNKCMWSLPSRLKLTLEVNLEMTIPMNELRSESFQQRI